MSRYSKYILGAIVALSSISCNKFLDEPLMDNTPDTLSARTENYSTGLNSKSGESYETQSEDWEDEIEIDTRTYAELDPENPSEYFQYWSQNDAISLFYGTTANLKYQLQSGGDNTDYGTFVRVDGTDNNTTVKSNYYYAVYPYNINTEIAKRNGEITYIFPDIQLYSTDTYANGANGMLAIEPKDNSDNVYEFKNFCCYLQLQLTSSESRVVTEIKLETNSAIAGEAVIFSYDDITPCVALNEDDINSITLNCKPGVPINETPTNFWFVLPAVDNDDFIGYIFENGFNITITFKSGLIYRKGTTKQIKIERNHIKPMASFDCDPDIVDATIIYKYKSTSTNQDALSFINVPGDKNFTDADGNLLEYTQEYNSEYGEWHVKFNGDLKTIGSNVFNFGDQYDLDYILINNADGVIVEDHAFWGSTAESIEFFNDVTFVGESAFNDSDVKYIRFNGDIGTIDKSAFENSAVESVVIVGSVSSIGENAFLGCTATNIEITGTVTSIGDKAFKGVDISSITLNSLESIGFEAFKECTNLTTVEISTADDNILTFKEGLFAGCNNLETIKLNAKIPPIFNHDNGPDEMPYFFPGTTKIYVPTLNDYKNKEYVYINHPSYINQWPEYFTGELLQL